MLARKLLSRTLSTTSSLNRKYGGRHTAVLIPGDGIGEEMAGYLLQIFKKMQAPIDFEKLQVTQNDILDEKPVVQQAITSIKRSGAAVMGNISTPVSGKIKSANHKIRNDLGLFANVIHAKTIDGVQTRHEDVDIILVRENTEGEYSGMEQETIPGVIETLKIITRPASEKVARFAFEYATEHKRRKVTCIHKANIMKQGDGLFLKTCRNMSKEFKGLQFGDMIVDNTCMQMVARPEQFDVMILPNLYGNVVSNITCGIVGGAGITAGANYNANRSLAIFETATRNASMTLSNYADNEANPVAFLMAGQLLLTHYNLPYHARIMEDAINYALCEEKIHTPDLGGNYGTKDMIKVIDGNIEKQLHTRNTFISGNYVSGRMNY